MTYYVLNHDTNKLLEINGKMKFTVDEVQSLASRKTIQKYTMLVEKERLEEVNERLYNHNLNKDANA